VAVTLAFFDTNVALYAFDPDNPAKQQQAQELLSEGSAWELACGVQVLGEFFHAARRKFGMTTAQAQAEMRKFEPLVRVGVDVKLVEAAIDLCAAKSISYWDALIVAAAARSGASILLTEDLNDGEEMAGVRILNPFAGL
jgi:predicted nucleic acid-binding protein